jgi:hypothetical protein
MSIDAVFVLCTSIGLLDERMIGSRKSSPTPENVLPVAEHTSDPAGITQVAGTNVPAGPPAATCDDIVIAIGKAMFMLNTVLNPTFTICDACAPIAMFTGCGPTSNATVAGGILGPLVTLAVSSRPGP